MTENFVNNPAPLNIPGKFLLHTESAQQLFYGKRGNSKKGVTGFIGLVRFSTTMNTIYKMARHDDPYADELLLKIEEKMNAAANYMADGRNTIEGILSESGESTSNATESLTPEELSLSFKTAYGFLGAKLLSQYDQLVQLYLLAKQKHLVSSDEWNQWVGKTAGMIRELFQLPTGYHSQGVTRGDMAANNKAARDAIEKFGELPHSILEGTRRAVHAPSIIQ